MEKFFQSHKHPLEEHQILQINQILITGEELELEWHRNVKKA